MLKTITLFKILVLVIIKVNYNNILNNDNKNNLKSNLFKFKKIKNISKITTCPRVTVLTIRTGCNTYSNGFSLLERAGIFLLIQLFYFY